MLDLKTLKIPRGTIVRTENLIRIDDVSESPNLVECRLAVAWIEVWVQFLVQSTIGFLNLLRGAGRFDAQHLIRILAHWHLQ